VNLFTSFLNLLYSFRLRQGGEDDLCWAPSKRRLFDVKSYYNVLVPHDGISFPLRSIWRNKAPLIVVFFACLAALKKILTVDNPKKWHVIVVNWCYMCKKSGESVDHLLLQCEMSRALWNSIFSLVGLAWVVPS